MSNFDKLINASDLIEWIMETYPDWCIGDVRGIVNHVNNMPTQSNTLNVLGKNDCIGRQAAIDEIDEWIKAFQENGHKESAADACLIQDGIIQLPSAQPSTHPLDPCETCLHKGKGWDDEPCDGCTQNDSKYEPERKRGKWIKISPANIYECSECGQNVMTQDIDVYKYCHGCGADMRGGDDETD